MAEQQLIDYIKKAKDAGQTDSQTRDLLYKNGWTEAEVNDALNALASLNQLKPQSQPQAQPEPQSQPEAVDLSQTESQPQEVQSQVVIQTQPQPKAVDLSQTESQPQVVIQTQPQPQIVSQPKSEEEFIQNNMPRTRSKSHLFLILLIVLIIVVILGGAGYFIAGQYINLPWSKFLNFSMNPLNPPDPQTVVNNMMADMKNVKSSHIIIQAEIDATSNGTSQGKLTLNSNSEKDTNDINNPKADGNFTINLTMPGSASPVTATVSIAAIGSTYYLKINEITIPATDSFADLSKNISAIQGKWLKIDQDSIKALNALSQASGGQAETGIDISQLSQAQTNSSDLTKQIQDLILSENMFSVTKQLNDETIGGQDTYHYLVTIKEAKLEDLINKLMALETQEASGSQTQSNTTNNTTSSTTNNTTNNTTNGTTNSTTNSTISNTTNNTTSSTTNNTSPLVTNMMQAFVKTLADSIGDINMEIWIGKKDYMLYQVKLDKTIDLSKILGSSGVAGNIGAGATSAANTQLEIKFNMTNSNFNQPITVQAPTDAQKIEEVLLPLIKIQNINNDMNQIGSEASSLFFTNKNYSLLCKNGFLNGSRKTSYGLEFISDVNDMIKQGAKNPVCFAGPQDYCVSTQLVDGSYLCIDKNGKLGATGCINAQTVCQ